MHLPDRERQKEEREIRDAMKNGQQQGDNERRDQAIHFNARRDGASNSEHR
jgi:hypothetical protein